MLKVFDNMIAYIISNKRPNQTETERKNTEHFYYFYHRNYFASIKKC